MIQEYTPESFPSPSSNSTQRRRQERSPIFKMPPELMSKIFILCLPPEFGFDSRLKNMFPLPVMITCKHWYDLAIRTPQLWCRYTVGWTFPPILYVPTFRFGAAMKKNKDWSGSLPSDRSKVKPVLKLWLSRAKTTLLDVKTLSFTNLDRSIWNILLKKIKQWRRWEHATPIKSSMDVDGILRFWDHIDKAESLQYLCSNFIMPPDQQEKYQVLGRLTKLSLKFHHNSVHLPFLTHLELSGSAISKFLEGTWTAAPALAELTLYSPKKADFDCIKSYLPSLRQVNIGVDDDGFSSFVYATTRFPSEVRFALTMTIDAFFNFLDQHTNEDLPEDGVLRCSKVDSLIVDGWVSDDTDGVLIFNSFPNITHFTLVCGVTEHALKSICFETSEPLPSEWTLPFCPKLQNVTLYESQVVASSLLEFTKSRALPQTDKDSKEGSSEDERRVARCLVSLVDCDLSLDDDALEPMIPHLTSANLDFFSAERLVNECFPEHVTSDQEDDEE